MRESLKDYLFGRGYFVADGGVQEHAASSVVALARLFNIRVDKRPELATPNMIRVAARNLGHSVPQPFYKGFPQSVRELGIDELIVDRLVHYNTTYGMGDFSQAGHSILERDIVRPCLDEKTAIRPMEILVPEEAEAKLRAWAHAALASTRPLSRDTYLMVYATLVDLDMEVTSCPCKDTVSQLIIDTRDVSLAGLLKLSDVLRLVELMWFARTGARTIRKLNLPNRDRKLVGAVLDHILSTCGDESGQNVPNIRIDVRTCYERRKDWCGLLHHIHYRPHGNVAEQFVRGMRQGRNRSVYATFEAQLAAGDVRAACATLAREKGAGAVLRHLDHLLSRCASEAEAAFVLDALATTNKVLLIQLLLHYANYHEDGQRTFRFASFGMMCVHLETEDEATRRASHVPAPLRMQAQRHLRAILADACASTLGKVYVDEGMRLMALPLQESTTMGGVGVLAKGSRIALPQAKAVRAFTYWERVDDIDLSAIGLTDDGRQVEFSWRSIGATHGDAIVYSGDQTSGFYGGSEYLDVDLEAFRAAYPDVHYLVFCDNVYSGVPFDECVCKAGYMLRDDVCSGEVFEPKTVKSSFAVVGKGTFAYLFAIDLMRNEFVWLNAARMSGARIAGTTRLDFLVDLLRTTEVISLYDFACLLAHEVVDDPQEADVVFSDTLPNAGITLREGAELIRSTDFERVIELLNS